MIEILQHIKTLFWFKSYAEIIKEYEIKISNKHSYTEEEKNELIIMTHQCGEIQRNLYYKRKSFEHNKEVLRNWAVVSAWLIFIFSHVHFQWFVSIYHFLRG